MARKALVVDDDDTMRFVLGEALRGSGWSVTEADDGSRVVERLEADAYDLVVLDLYMPGMNGFEVLRQIRQHRDFLLPGRRTPASVRVVVLSGAASSDAFNFARRLGADACLAKPFDVGELLQVVEA
jgi:CheY-like chemotaxis protein